jgi:hypothetical protein
MRWNESIPPPGTRIVLGQNSQPDCTVDVGYITASGAIPPRHAIFLEKRDSSPGSCSDPKGYRTLWVATYSVPHILLATHPTAPHLFVVAYDHKNTPSGSSPTQLDMEQVDWLTGDTVHTASKFVKGTPPPAPPPPASPTALGIADCTVHLWGTGSFSGASGAPTGQWVAHFHNFLAPLPQPPSPADTASYE